MSENNINLEAKDQPSEATTYGGLLRIARENKELSIDQVSSQLRISPDQIEGLESDNYKVFPTPVYARAHLRSYARLLGVDEAKIISLFNAALAPDDKDPRTFIRRTTQELAPYHDAQPKNFVGKFIAGLLFLAVVIALGWIGYNYYMSQKTEKAAEAGDVREIPLSELHEFYNHPFQIRSDEELAEMIESVREHGVLVPGIVRKRKEGGYEIISGHTRKHVCEVLGLETMPVFVKEMDNDEASVVMVDSNIQRENIRPSEKAKAYKIKYDAMKNQGKAGNSLKMMSEESGENYKMIQRYIWLARLSDDLLALVDNKQLGLVQGVSLSVLPEEEQSMVYDAICRYGKKISTIQANGIKKFSLEGKLDADRLEEYLFSIPKQKKKKEITLRNERLSEYFEEETTEEEMMKIILELLDEWKQKRGGGQNE